MHYRACILEKEDINESNRSFLRFETKHEVIDVWANEDSLRCSTMP